MTTRVQVRAGEVELTIESDNPLAMTDIKELLSQVQEAAEALRAPYATALVQTPQDTLTSRHLMIEGGAPQLHINSVAERIGIRSGSDLAIASAAYLQIVKGQQTFTRAELLDTMKAATSHYTQNHRSNLSSMLKSLIGTKFNQTGNDTYAIKNQELIAMRAKLVE